MPTTFEIFSQTIEFDRWAHGGNDVRTDEAFMLERFLDPKRSVLEGGAAAGRLLRYLQARGFRSLTGFDFVPGLIDMARQRDASAAIDFHVQEATNLNAFADGTFDQAIYLQQIMCGLETDAERRQALREMRRVLRPGGVAIISFLCYESRSRSLKMMAFMMYLRCLRAVTFARRGPQQFPMLMTNYRLRWPALLDSGPHMYWFRIPEVHDLLTSEGFDIFAAGVDHELAKGIVHAGCAELAKRGALGTIYVACRTRP